MIPILPAAAWREFRGAAKNKGQNHTTHQALIADGQGGEHLCYVKASPPEFPMVVAESIAWMIAKALGLPRPEFAAVIVLPVPRLMQHMRLDQHWRRYPTVLGYCSSAVPGKHIASRWKLLAALLRVAAFRHPSVAEIAAFDTWVENQDRHLGNFLRTTQGSYVPIDNELILYSLLWLASGLTFGHNSLRAAARAQLKSGDYKRFEAAMILASDRHLPALQDVSPRLRQFILTMASDPQAGSAFAAAVLDFLNTRAQPGWLANELGQIS